MSQEIRQTVKTEQGLAITPQLKRSLDILQAPALEVEKIIENIVFHLLDIRLDILCKKFKLYQTLLLII